MGVRVVFEDDRNGKISTGGLDSMDLAQRDLIKKTEGRYSPGTVPTKPG